MIDLFDSFGRKIELGKKIASGGEGVVYEVPSLGNNIAAKMYTGAMLRDKQEKLRRMAMGYKESLKKIAAWPQITLHESVGGSTRGFLMERLIGYEPIHHLYGPSHRKQRYPDKDWSFLVFTARNTASAFQTLHSHDCVIGDVNPNLVFVGSNSTVKLIDCDSFQIFADGRCYPCEVGSPHFTPPELQNSSTFRGIVRTVNQDNFGLAVLLFHILLMGRHPFSGIFSGTGDNPLEKSIGQFRYAFGRNAAIKGIAPPPNSITTAILPGTISELFERAFTEQGTFPGSRPSAQEWVIALDSLREQLRSCNQESNHKYFSGLSSCPWCVQEQKSGFYFFISYGNSRPGYEGFDLSQIWARIIAIEPPEPPPELTTYSFQVSPEPLSRPVTLSKFITILQKTAAAGLVLVCLFTEPQFFVYALIISLSLFFLGFQSNYTKEKKRRKSVLDEAHKEMAATKEHWFHEACDSKFQDILKELSHQRAEFDVLALQLEQEKTKLQQNLPNDQLQKFLDTFFISSSSIPSIGPARKAVLLSFGIETAADINRNRIINISGFGPYLAGELDAWRNKIENRFVFCPSKGTDPADIKALNQRFSQKRKQIEISLLAGPEKLLQVRNEIVNSRSQLLPVIISVTRKVVQAEADLSVLRYK